MLGSIYQRYAGVSQCVTLAPTNLCMVFSKPAVWKNHESDRSHHEMKRNITFGLLFIGILVLAEAVGGIAGIYIDLWGDRIASYIAGSGLAALPAFALAFLAARRIAPPSKPVGIGVFVLFTALAALHFGIGLEPPEGKFIFYPDIDTAFAPGYSNQAFAEVAIGMTESNVLSRLGQPASRQEKSSWSFPGDAQTLWWYSHDGACSWGDFAWRAPMLGFKDGSVVSKWTVWCFD